MADTKTAADVADHALTQIDKFSDSIATLADKLAEIAKQHGPDAWEAAQAVARIDAANHLLWALPVFAVSVVCILKFSVPLLRTAHRLHTDYWKPETRADAPDGFVPGLGGVIIGVASLAFGAAALTSLCNLWAWVGIFEPKLWLAMKVLKLG